MARAGRGTWRRAQSRGERRRLQRARIVDAAARAGLERHRRPLTLSNIVESAGIGRNSFYDHFVDVAAAIAAAEAEGLGAASTAIAAAIANARTPLERLRGAARAWVDAAAAHPGLALTVHRESLDWSSGDPMRLDVALSNILDHARSAGIVGRPPDSLRVRCVVGAFDAAALIAIDATPIALEELAETLVDLTLRAFR